MKFFTSSREAIAFSGVDLPADFTMIEAVYPVLLNEYYLSLIDWKNFRHDPIALQSFPQQAELADEISSSDPLAEEKQMPVPRLIHRFKDRVVILANSHCAMRCRFCFRKREWANGASLPPLTDSELDEIISYLQKHPEIREILLSGGDNIDFMIHGVFSYNLFGQEVWITTSHICLLIVVLVLLLFFIIGGSVFRKAETVPKGFQNFAEMIVELLDGIVIGGMGEKGKGFRNYIGVLFIFTADSG